MPKKAKPSRKPIESLTLMDNFMFFATMMKEENLRPLLERILGKRISRLVYLHTQESIKANYESKGIILDVLCWDEDGNMYDVEVQTTNKKDEVLRSRLYHSNMDVEKYPPGTKYSDLKESYVIFICNFDIEGEKKILYSYSTRRDDPPHKRLKDGRYTYFLNIHGEQKRLRKGLRPLIKLLKENKATDSYI